MDVTLQEMLQAREARANLQHALLAEFRNPLVSFTMNIAGPVKDSPAIRRGFQIGLAALEEGLSLEGILCLHRESVRSHTGWEEMLVLDAPAKKIKSITTQIEESSDLGRLFDMDVLDLDGSKLERSAPRRCLICGEIAQVCARNRRHTVAQLQEATAAILEKAMLDEDIRFAAQMAQQALLYEVGITPKPGLVDRRNNGSHRDMDFFTFQRSAVALYPYFEECVRIGRTTRNAPPTETLKALRLPGRRAEAAMGKATGGVNTHKGAIFSLGLLCGALGRLERPQWKEPEQVLSLCSQMAADLMKDFEIPGNTVGYQLYQTYGITGIRGQAAAGYPAVSQIALPRLEQGLERGLSINDAACAALLALIAHTEDTNMIHRGGRELAVKKAAQVAALLDQEPFPCKEKLEALDDSFIADNLSPGGCADLLAMTLMLWFLKN